MTAYELVDMLINDGHSSVWFYRARLLTDEDEVSVMFLLQQNGEEVARRIYAQEVNGWRQTFSPKAPVFPVVPVNAFHVDMTDPATASWDIDMHDSEYAQMDSIQERIK
ncbi:MULTISPECIES: hypothetical protein [Leclercia]|uniref:hypothetical protein n=1 Tax=Leclercia TaxID=83654 RepID=UPI001331249F|nr:MULTISPECIES: hypothetical protein [Leclercia]